MTSNLPNNTNETKEKDHYVSYSATTKSETLYSKGPDGEFSKGNYLTKVVYDK